MEKPKVIIMLGGPASGKGTQAKKLSEKTGYTYFGTGDLLRSEVSSGSELGKKFKELMNRGELVPDELTDPLVVARLNELKNKGIILDGYPRNLNQATTLKSVFPAENFLVLNISVSPESLLERMLSRRVCAKCGKIFIVKTGESKICDDCGGELIQRADDNQEVLSKRIETYNQVTKPIIDYYREKNLLVDIDGEPAIDEVEKQIDQVVDKYLK